MPISPSNNHAAFIDYVKQSECILEIHRISGEGCYWLNAVFFSQTECNELLQHLLVYGNYRVTLSMETIK